MSPSIANFPAGLAHDARNLLAAMDIYCELLKAPGVLDAEHRHLADELLLLRDSSSSLVDRMLMQALQPGSDGHAATGPRTAFDPAALTELPVETMFDTYNDLRQPAKISPEEVPSGRRCVQDIRTELLATHTMLCALAGPKVHVDLDTEDAPAGELLIAQTDFTRVLINLIRNAAEAMGTGGRILISAKANAGEGWLKKSVSVSVEDNGPGIPLALLDRIFELSSNTGASSEHARRRMSFRPRGLGLRIVRELVEGGGGTIHACRLPERGSRFEIVLPMVTRK